MDKVYHSPGSFFKPLTPDEHQEFMYYVKLRRLEMLANYGDWLGRELQKIRAQLKSAATESGRTGRWEAHLGIGRMSVHVFRFQEEEVNPGRAGDNTEPNTKAWLDEYRRVAFTESASVVEFAKLEILRAQIRSKKHKSSSPRSPGNPLFFTINNRSPDTNIKQPSARRRSPNAYRFAKARSSNLRTTKDNDRNQHRAMVSFNMMASRRIHNPKKWTTREREITGQMDKMEVSKEIDDLEMTDEAKLAYALDMEIVVELLEDSDMLDLEVVEVLEMMEDLKLFDGPEMDKDVEMAV